jgi:glutathione S-transferase
MSPFSPYARKPRVVLLEKGLEFEGIDTQTATPNALLAERNPNLRIPVLIDEAAGRTLWESNVVVDYLLTTYPATPPAAPVPPLAQTLVRAEHRWDDLLVLSTIETTLNSGVNLIQMVRGGIDPDQVPFLRKEKERIGSNLTWLNTQATPEGFIPGVFSIADLNLVIALQWLAFREMFAWQGMGFTNLEAILSRYVDRPSVAATAPK